jgi:hypothetical protein
MNDEAQMTNAHREHVTSFGLRNSTFFRHSSFDIRH